MKKSVLMIMVLGLMAFGAFAGNLQDATAATAAITTNSQNVTLGAVGEIKLLTIALSATSPVSITIKDQLTSAVVYQNAALSAGVTLIPRLPVTTSSGAAITVSDGAVTNSVYAPVNCMGLVVTAVASSNTANIATIKAITNKAP